MLRLWATATTHDRIVPAPETYTPEPASSTKPIMYTIRTGQGNALLGRFGHTLRCPQLPSLRALGLLKLVSIDLFLPQQIFEASKRQSLIPLSSPVRNCSIAG